MNSRIAHWLAAAAMLACVARPALAEQTIERRLPELERVPSPTFTLGASAGKTLRALLADGYEIIHIDAPAGTNGARFILRNTLDIYSCEPAIYREAGDGDLVRVIVNPCLYLTPDA